MQKAIADYLQNSSHYNELSDFYQQKRDLFLGLINETRFNFIPSQGTYFQSLDYSDITNENDVDFSKRLIVENKIASIPLSVFNSNGRDDKILRFCFAKTDEMLKSAAEILNKIQIYN